MAHKMIITEDILKETGENTIINKIKKENIISNTPSGYKKMTKVVNKTLNQK